MGICKSLFRCIINNPIIWIGALHDIIECDRSFMDETTALKWWLNFDDNVSQYGRNHIYDWLIKHWAMIQQPHFPTALPWITLGAHWNTLFCHQKLTRLGKWLPHMHHTAQLTYRVTSTKQTMFPRGSVSSLTLASLLSANSSSHSAIAFHGLSKDPCSRYGK